MGLEGGGGGRTARRPGGRLGTAIGGIHDVHFHTRHARNTFDRFARLARQRAGIFAGEHEGECDRAGGVDDDFLHHAGRDDITAVTRIDDAAQRLLDVGFDLLCTHTDLPLARNARAALSTFSSTSAMVPGKEAPAAR